MVVRVPAVLHTPVLVAMERGGAMGHGAGEGGVMKIKMTLAFWLAFSICLPGFHNLLFII